MSSLLISVVVPIYNVEHYLERCLDSIISQTYTNLEIILVDDGSTDRSGAIADAYAAKDSRVKVIHQKTAAPVSPEIPESRPAAENISCSSTVTITSRPICANAFCPASLKRTQISP